MIDKGLGGRIALVSGANGGIGATTAEALAAEGASVAVHFLDVNPNEKVAYRRRHAVPGRAAADFVVEHIRERGGRACSNAL